MKVGDLILWRARYHDYCKSSETGILVHLETIEESIETLKANAIEEATPPASLGKEISSLKAAREKYGNYWHICFSDGVSCAFEDELEVINESR